MKIRDSDPVCFLHVIEFNGLFWDLWGTLLSIVCGIWSPPDSNTAQRDLLILHELCLTSVPACSLALKVRPPHLSTNLVLFMRIPER